MEGVSNRADATAGWLIQPDGDDGVRNRKKLGRAANGRVEDQYPGRDIRRGCSGTHRG